MLFYFQSYIIHISAYYHVYITYIYIGWGTTKDIPLLAANAPKANKTSIEFKDNVVERKDPKFNILWAPTSISQVPYYHELEHFYFALK